MRQSSASTIVVIVLAVAGAVGLSVWWVQSEIETSFIQEIDVSLAALQDLRTHAGPRDLEDQEMLRAIEEHENALDVFALTLARLRGDSSQDARRALARIRDYRRNYPRVTSNPDQDALVRAALALDTESAQR
jgi:hypothetical protein